MRPSAGTNAAVNIGGVACDIYAGHVASVEPGISHRLSLFIVEAGVNLFTGSVIGALSFCVSADLGVPVLVDGVGAAATSVGVFYLLDAVAHPVEIQGILGSFIADFGALIALAFSEGVTVSYVDSQSREQVTRFFTDENDIPITVPSLFDWWVCTTI